MPRRRRRDPYTADLLSWQPPAPVARYAPEQVRAASLDAAMCKAMKVALAECRKSRAAVVDEMTAFLGGERVTENMLNAYVSPGRESHVINIVRFIALLSVTKDRRLLELIADQFGWAVIDQKHLPYIELAQLAQKREELDQQLEATKRALRSTGGRS